MSVVVGLVKEGHVYLAADTRALEGYDRSECKKLFVNDHKQWGTWALGAAGYMRNAEVATQLDLPTLTRRQLKHVTVTDLARGYFDALRCEVMQHGIMQENLSGSSFLLALKGRLFTVEDSFCMREITTMAAIGSGAEYARGTIWALQTYCPDMPPDQMVRAAVECAATFSVSVGGNIDVVVI